MHPTRFDEAFSFTADILRIEVELGDVQHQLDTMSLFASIHAQAGHAELATRLLSSSVALHEGLGLKVPLYQEKRNEATLARIHAQVDDAAFAEAWKQGGQLTADEAVALALDSLD